MSGRDGTTDIAIRIDVHGGRLALAVALWIAPFVAFVFLLLLSSTDEGQVLLVFALFLFAGMAFMSAFGAALMKYTFAFEITSEGLRRVGRLGRQLKAAEDMMIGTRRSCAADIAWSDIHRVAMKWFPAPVVMLVSRDRKTRFALPRRFLVANRVDLSSALERFCPADNPARGVLADV